MSLVTSSGQFVPIVLAGVAAIVLWRLASRQRLPGPPGPPPLPVIGNLHQFPSKHAHRAWHEWAKKYGPVIQINAFSQRIVIIDSHQVATELLTGRGQIYSGRPILYMSGREVGWDRILTLFQPGEKLRESRRMFHRTIDGRRVERFKDHVYSEVAQFVVRLYRDPEEFRHHIRSTAAGIILIISHGYTVDHRPNQDRLVQLAHKALADLAIAGAPGKWMVDFFPFLTYVPTWFPGATFKRVAKGYRETLDQFSSEPLAYVKHEMKAGTARPSSTQMLLEEIDGSADNPAQEEMIKWAMTTMFAGGADTSISTIFTFFLAMSRHPHIVAAAHEELDSVIGEGRLPTMEDRQNLPYLEAIMTEAMRKGLPSLEHRMLNGDFFRYAPPIPGGVPHMATEDDIYEGYLIKKGTMVMPNLWGMMHDEDQFPDPREFRPERYLEEVVARPGVSRWKYVAAPCDPRVVIFGYGRRFCPGRDLALMTLWIEIATVLHLLKIEGKGDNIPPMAEHEYEDGALSPPTPFDCSITPRSKKAEELLKTIEQALPSTHV